MASHQAAAVTLSGPGAVGATEVEVEISPGPRKGSRSLETLEFQASLEADKEKSARAIERSGTFREQQRYYHDKHGEGTVVSIKDGLLTIRFDNGETHGYNVASQRKLKPVLEDAHALTPETLFKIVDTDSSGHLDLKEFIFLHLMIVKGEKKHSAKVAEAKASEEQQRQAAKRMRKQLFAATGIICILLAAMAGLMVAVIDAYKDTEASGAYFAATDGSVLQTAPAMVALPMVVAPVIPLPQLQGVQQLAITYFDTVTQQEVQVSPTVDTIALFNATAVIFYMARGPVDEVHVWNGDAYAVLATGAKAAICEADVSCSALTVEDSGSAYTYLDQATEALTQAGFDASSVIASRRRLSGEDSRLRALAGGCSGNGNENSRDVDKSICSNSDNGELDNYGDACSDYEGHPNWCGEYDDDDFTAELLCCECGGGAHPPPPPSSKVYPNWYSSNAVCGKDPPKTNACWRDSNNYGVWPANPTGTLPWATADGTRKGRGSDTPAGQGPIHFPPGSHLTPRISVQKADGGTEFIMSMASRFASRLNVTVTGEVVKAITPTGSCAQAHGISRLADVVDGKSWIQNADELAGKIVLCQRSTSASDSSSVSFAEMNLFVSYAVPTAKAILVMNNGGNSNDGQGLAVMNDGYDTCGQQGDKWGNALRHPDVYRAGCTTPMLSILESDGSSLQGKQVTIEVADEFVKDTITVTVTGTRYDASYYSGFNGVYVPQPTRCHYQSGTQSYSATWDSAGQHECLYNDFDSTSPFSKYVKQADLSGSTRKHYLGYFLQTGTSSFWGFNRGWLLAIGSENTDYLAAGGITEWFVQEDADGTNMAYPTDAPWIEIELGAQINTGAQINGAITFNPPATVLATRRHLKASGHPTQRIDARAQGSAGNLVWND